MIKIGPNAHVAIEVAAWTSLLYGLFVAPKGTTRRRAAIVVGLLGPAALGLAWKQANDERNATRNPEVMNGYFLTGGRASAVTGGLADVGYLRSVMGIPATRRRSRGDHLR